MNLSSHKIVYVILSVHTERFFSVGLLSGTDEMRNLSRS